MKSKKQETGKLDNKIRNGSAQETKYILVHITQRTRDVKLNRIVNLIRDAATNRANRNQTGDSYTRTET